MIRTGRLTCSSTSSAATVHRGGAGFEEGGGGIDKFWAVLHAIEARGVHVALSYIPRWYWERIGKPDLSRVPGLFQSSYVEGPDTPQCSTQATTPSGGQRSADASPDVLQFTDRALIAGKTLDADAFRVHMTNSGRCSDSYREETRRNGWIDPELVNRAMVLLENIAGVYRVSTRVRCALSAKVR